MMKAEGERVTGLRSIFCGGEPLGAEIQDWGREALGLTINEGYGQTECNAVLANCADLFPPKAGCTGKPAPGHEVEVIDAEGNATHEEGDIAIKRGTAVMMLEYWNNPTATADKFVTGPEGVWLLTGDRGIRRADGKIKFIGRDDDIIGSAGYRIGPAEIEDCLIQHPAVKLAGVVGMPDELRGQVVAAYVELVDDVDATSTLAAEIANFVKTKLAAHEYPRVVRFVDALPKTTTGKIIRGKLREKARQEYETARAANPSQHPK